MSADVLVVEDDLEVCESIAAVIESHLPWVRVSSASDGVEALELLEDGLEPCLALLDLLMPVMNGLQFLESLRERQLAPSMSVVLLSGHVHLAEKVRHPRVTGLLPKPLRIDELLTVVRKYCADGTSSPPRAPP